MQDQYYVCCTLLHLHCNPLSGLSIQPLRPCTIWNVMTQTPDWLYRTSFVISHNTWRIGFDMHGCGILRARDRLKAYKTHGLQNCRHFRCAALSYGFISVTCAASHFSLCTDPSCLEMPVGDWDIGMRRLHKRQKELPHPPHKASEVITSLI